MELGSFLLNRTKTREKVWCYIIYTGSKLPSKSVPLEEFCLEWSVKYRFDEPPAGLHNEKSSS